MSTVVFLVRGINVGGHRPLKMEVLRRLCEGLGLTHVRTYLNSGNVVCEAGEHDIHGKAAAIERRIAADCGFEADVAALTGKAIARAISGNPLVGLHGVDPQFLHVNFMIRPPARLSLDESELPLARGERAVLMREVIYLYFPCGNGISKISNAYFERKLGVRATTRNWRTVNALDRMVRGGTP